EKLRGDLRSAQAHRDREEAARLLADARKLFTNGLLKEAKAKAYQAQQLHGPYGIWELGDRPARLLAEHEQAESKQRQGAAGPASNPGGSAKNNPAGAASDKQRAQGLVAEARRLEQQGRLVEAMQKAGEAARFGNLFGLDEDSPQKVMIGLAG